MRHNNADQPLDEHWPLESAFGHDTRRMQRTLHMNIPSSCCVAWRWLYIPARYHRSFVAGAQSETDICPRRLFLLFCRLQPAAGVGDQGGVPAQVPQAAAGHLRHSHPGASGPAAPAALSEEVRVRQGDHPVAPHEEVRVHAVGSWVWVGDGPRSHRSPCQRRKRNGQIAPPAACPA